MIRTVAAAIFLSVFYGIGEAQVPPTTGSPVLESTGDVHINLSTGLLDGKVCLRHRAADALSAFSLSAGLNVARVTDGTGQAINFSGWSDPGVDGEARLYQLKGKPETLCVSYVGAYPVYKVHDAPDDFKGVIAFNGDSVRATEQAAWLPTPYNTDRRMREGDTSYDLNVSCDGCRFLYLNGSPAVEQPNAHFVSKIARPPLLFGGTGPITRTQDVTILNENVSTPEAAALSSTFGQIERYYSSYLGKDFTDKPILLRMVTLNQNERDRRGSSWGFATWPTIALSGSVGKLGQSLMSPSADKWSPVPYLAHESAHFYFGTVARPSGPYFWFLLESTAEYLSMKAETSLLGQSSGDQQVALWSKALQSEQASVIPLDEVTNADQIGSTYRYDLGPLLLFRLQQRVGEEKMQAFMRLLLEAPSIVTWQDFKALALKSGISETQWSDWQRTCIVKDSHACLEA